MTPVAEDLRTQRPLRGRDEDSAPRRLNVLVSAYACAPGRGSEPGIGWNNAREAARRNEVWVITRRIFRSAIEAELERNPVPGLHFVYCQLPQWITMLGSLGYYAWQAVIYPLARRLHQVHRFDVTHHVSYVRAWTPSLLALLPIPFIWGPVGGGETVPTAFRRDLRVRARLEELTRDVVGWLSAFDPLLRLTARRSALAIANSDDTARRVKELGAPRVIVLGESGVDELPLSGLRVPVPERTTARFGSLTRLTYWKGLHLGIKAFARLRDPDAEYWIIGEGAEEQHLRALARELGVADRVVFRQGLSRAQWMATITEVDALLHPCICNTGNAITLEAMALGRPVICLNRGGVAMQVTDETGFKVSADDPDAAVAGLAEAMRSVIADREGAATKGRYARARVEHEFTWKRRGELMQEYYVAAAGAVAPRRQTVRAETEATDNARSSI